MFIVVVLLLKELPSFFRVGLSIWVESNTSCFGGTDQVFVDDSAVEYFGALSQMAEDSCLAFLFPSGRACVPDSLALSGCVASPAPIGTIPWPLVCPSSPWTPSTASEKKRPDGGNASGLSVAGSGEGWMERTCSVER